MASNNEKCISTPEYSVYIANILPPNSVPLIAHCASKDVDLGNHTLTLFQNFNWSFCDSSSKNTSFFCHLWWGSKEALFNVFTSDTRDKCYKNSCYWEARFEGILFDGVYPPNPQTLKKVYNWNDTKMN